MEWCVVGVSGDGVAVATLADTVLDAVYMLCIGVVCTGADWDSELFVPCGSPPLPNLASVVPQRKLLWEMKDEIVEPFGEKAIQVFARISALRDRLDGPQADDQVNTGNERCFSSEYVCKASAVL